MQTDQRRAPRIAPRDVVSQPSPARLAVRGPKAVGSFVPRLTQRAFEKYGFSAATLITDWETIVGSALARYTAPERLKWPKAVSSLADDEAGGPGRPGATLILGVDPGRALDVQYRSAQLIERINAYFGYRAVAELRIVQVPGAAALGATAASTRPAPVAAPRRDRPPPAELVAVTDDRLRAALERMATGLSTRSATA